MDEETLSHVDESLGIIPAIGLCGGLALYMAAHVPCDSGQAARGAVVGRPQPSCSSL